MDCKTAKEKINIFDALSEQDKERVLAHAQGCESCKNELIYSAKLKDALGSLDELEPPLGLASSAIARAKKKSRIPPIAYISVAAAAVIAVAFIVSSSVLNLGDDNAADAPVEMALEEQSVRSDDFAADAQEAPMAEMANEEAVVLDMAADDAVAKDETAEDVQEALAMEEPEEESDASMAKGDTSFIYVSADNAGFAEQLEAFFVEFDTYVEYTEFDGNTAMKFFLGELQLGSFVELLEQFDIPYDDSLVSGAMVEVTFVK
ncbi:MAG: hypothetical protein HN948_06355 [Clostridia bacterium]|jgi:hypothetical protein|nr:hypothetical protein [Clostridia bacterium]MBT7122618.1 hypothetical protein [Clostridia bacterium]